MEKLTTATGKVFNVNYLAKIPNPEQIYVRIAASIAEVADVFSKKEETSKLVYEGILLEGYTTLVVIVPEQGVVRICLRKEN